MAFSILSRGEASSVRPPLLQSGFTWVATGRTKYVSGPASASELLAVAQSRLPATPAKRLPAKSTKRNSNKARMELQ
jgi:hypothetical protein